MQRIVLLLAFLAAVAGNVRAQNREAVSILERYDSIRPGPTDLAMYRLDWTASLDEARERATRENRPILLVIIHAKYGDISSGHC